MSHPPLQLEQATALADIIRAAQGNLPVTRLDSDDTTILTGTARSVGAEDFTFACRGADVRDLFLRVTLTSGTEVAWPIHELMDDLRNSRLALNYRAT